jgi:hypothetical protein
MILKSPSFTVFKFLLPDKFIVLLEEEQKLKDILTPYVGLASLAAGLILHIVVKWLSTQGNIVFLGFQA